MVGSRHLQGTIISRVKHLLESGSLKNVPVWYDVVRRFPPPSTSLLSLVAEEDKREIPKITYPVDDIKREFYVQHFRAARDPTSLFPDIKTEENKTDVFLKEYQKNIDAGEEHSEAFNKALSFFQKHLNSLRGQNTTVNSADQNSVPLEKEDDVDLSVKDIYQMFSVNKKDKK